jgi:hypothetical protein
MKNRYLQEIDEIWEMYQFQIKNLKFLRQSIKAAGKGNIAIKKLLDTSDLLIGIPTPTLQVDKAEKQIQDFIILSMWVVFERCLAEYLQQIVNVPTASDTTSTAYLDIRKEVLKRVSHDVEWWKVDDKLEMVKPLLTGKIVGILRQFKNYRDWIAHRSAWAVPPKAAPQFVFDTLREAIEYLI